MDGSEYPRHEGWKYMYVYMMDGLLRFRPGKTNCLIGMLLLLYITIYVCLNMGDERADFKKTGDVEMNP